jgi:hypothetical protein
MSEKISKRPRETGGIKPASNSKYSIPLIGAISSTNSVMFFSSTIETKPLPGYRGGTAHAGKM